MSQANAKSDNSNEFLQEVGNSIANLKIHNKMLDKALGLYFHRLSSKEQAELSPIRAENTLAQTALKTVIATYKEMYKKPFIAKAQQDSLAVMSIIKTMAEDGANQVAKSAIEAIQSVQNKLIEVDTLLELEEKPVRYDQHVVIVSNSLMRL